jgi:hypothetical protein
MEHDQLCGRVVHNQLLNHEELENQLGSVFQGCKFLLI